MTRAEEAALKVYPPTFSRGKLHAKRVQSEKVDTHAPIRTIFRKGYEQALKDLQQIIVMFSEMLLQIALDMGTKDGWVTPTNEELNSLLNVDSFVQWLIDHNPDKADIIKERYNNFKNLTL